MSGNAYCTSALITNSWNLAVTTSGGPNAGTTTIPGPMNQPYLCGWEYQACYTDQPNWVVQTTSPSASWDSADSYVDGSGNVYIYVFVTDPTLTSLGSCPCNGTDKNGGSANPIGYPGFLPASTQPSKEGPFYGQC
jgi:hypothetical protein